MIALNSKFRGSWLIRSGLNKALFRVEEVQQKEQEQEQEGREKHDFKAHLADWSELARV